MSIHSRKRRALIICAASAALLAGGCVSRPKEQASPGELLILGEQDLKSERFESARQAFQRLLREHPESKHRREALINLADSFYKEGQYIEARVQYSEYVQLYPISPKTPKAYFYLGMSDYNQRKAFDQDQGVIRDAIKNFRTLIKRFPRSEFRREAEKKVKEMRKLLAKHELFIARFYMHKKFQVSAIPRLRKIIKEFTDQPEIRAEAMYLLGESYLREESFRKAGAAYQNLIRSYPTSRLARQAYARLSAIAERR